MLTFYFFKRENRINAAFILSLLYTIVSIMAVAIHILNLYENYGINRHIDSVAGTFFYCLGLTLIIYPFSKLHISSDSSFSLQNPRLFNIMCYTICLCVVVYVTVHFSEILYSLTTDADDVKAQHYDDLASGPQNMQQALFMYPINILSSAWSLLLVCWFICTIFLKKGIVFNTMLLLCSLGGILKGSLIAGRAAIIYWIFCFITLFSIFIPYVTSKQIRKRIILSVLIPMIAIIISFISITIARFAYRGENEALYSFIGYAGQQYNNFCAVFEYGKNLPFTIERIMPITYKYILGGQFDLLDYYDTISYSTGIVVNNFYTILGGLYLTTGGYFTILCVISLSAISSHVCAKLTSTMDFSYFILLSIIILIPIKGMFDVPFPNIGDSLLNIALICLFLFFRRSISLK